MDDGTRDEGTVRHRYRICEVQPREKRTGRPKRVTVMSWDDLSDEDVAVLQRLHEGRLAANQVAELDGRTVKRGSGVTAADVDEVEVEAPLPPRSDSPADITDFAHRVCWDILARDRVAAEEIRRQSQELSERSLEQGRRVDAMINELAALRIELMRQQPAPAARISIEDIKNLMTIGAGIVRDVMKGSGSGSGSGAGSSGT